MFLRVLDAVLLFALSIPVVMYYRILPVDGTPYWLFGILFAILTSHCVISFYPSVLGRFKNYINAIKNFFLIVTISIVLVGPTWTSIVDRAKTAPVHGVHDIILQQEAAMRYVINGKNPYKETYFGTPMEAWHYGELGRDAVNPALYHFVMPPWYLVFPFPFYFVSNAVFGFFDGRMVLLFMMALLLVVIWVWIKDKQLARIAVILTALSPSVTSYFIEGRSDVFALGWLILSLYVLNTKKYVLSAILLGLAFLSKQTTWFIFPFYALYLWLHTTKNRHVFWKSIILTVLVSIIGIAPFFLWDPKAFVDSVVLYLTGNTLHSYPISGYGLGMMLYDFGYIKNIHDYYPFVYWQIVFALPLFLALIVWLKKEPTISRLIVAYACFLCVYWYLSRYFNNSHLGYLSMLFVLGGIKVADDTNQ